jgi:Family of unknown function (DUF5675)
MLITIVRDTLTENSTIGKLSLEGSSLVLDTLEPPTRETKPCAIPLGMYQVALLKSPKFGFITPHVLNVPGFTAIEIHIGNGPADTEGCTLVGLSRGTDFIYSSKPAFQQLMAVLSAGNVGQIKAQYICTQPST